MSQQPVYIVDIMGEIVSRVSAAMDFNVHYFYGRSPEVINSITNLTKRSISSYPFIYLVMPFDEEKNSIEQNYNVSLHLVIVSRSTEHDIASDRYRKVFKPILYPILDELMNQLASSGYFITYSKDSLIYTKTDWPHYGSKGNFTNDFTDAIDLSNIKLKVDFINCQKYIANVTDINS